MTDERHQQLKELFLVARPLGAAERKEYLATACADDSALRREVEALLVHDEAPLELLEGVSRGAGVEFLARNLPDDEPTATVDAPAAAELPGQIGPYTVLRLLGQGGMGVVYEAQQENPRRTVALKVIRPEMATPEVLHRFQFEAQVLGQLKHPGIAQIYEAGTAEIATGDSVSGEIPPRPFFAMELVRGTALLDHAAGRNLDTGERLALMAKTCDAVQYAHQKGVIHRDLKPGNILVEHGEGAEPQPKILDFGVARAIHSDLQLATMQTVVGQLVGTLAYMSPEQILARPEELDTRSDVYALGVILYELLAGRLPYDIRGLSLPEVGRVIREEEPSRLSSVRTSYRGDIETIVAKALAKEKDRRYASAAEFAEDLRRTLRDQPIVARPASTLYQLRKFARRNRAFVGAVGAAFVILVVALVVASAQSLRIRRETIRTADINQILESILVVPDTFRFSGRPQPPEQFGAHVLLTDLLDDAVTRLDRETQTDEIVEATVRHHIGVSYSAAGRLGPSAEQLERALEIRRELLGEEATDTLLTKIQLATTLAASQPNRGDRLAREAVTGLRRALGSADRRTVKAMIKHTFVLCELWRYEEALALAEEARDIIASEGPELDIAPYVPETMIAVARAFGRGEFDEAAAQLRRALEDTQRATGGRHSWIGWIEFNLGWLAADRGQMESAETHFRAARRILSQYWSDDSHQATVPLEGLAALLENQGKHDEAVQRFQEFLEAAEVEGNPRRVAWALDCVTRNLQRAGRHAEAEGYYRRWLELRASGTLEEEYKHGATLLSYALLLKRTGRTDEVQPHLEEAFQVGERQTRGNKPWDHRVVLIELARRAESQGDARRAAEIRNDLRQRLDQTPDVWTGAKLARALREAGQTEAAAAEYERWLAHLQGPRLRDTRHRHWYPPRMRRHEQRMIRELVELYEAAGASDRATLWRARLTSHD